jgi:hypothetical protein
MTDSDPVAQKQQEQWLVSHSIQNQGHPTLLYNTIRTTIIQKLEQGTAVASATMTVNIPPCGQVRRNIEKTTGCLRAWAF